MDSATRESFEKVLFEKACLPAILEQAKADRDNGKVLCPEMDEIVNIYSQILTDYPEPVTQGVTQ